VLRSIYRDKKVVSVFVRFGAPLQAESYDRPHVFFISADNSPH
jgi:hypothetical protein